MNESKVTDKYRERGVSGEIPYFPEVGVMGLVPEEWGGSWQPRHQVLTRLASYFNVVWVNPARGWRELWFDAASSAGKVDFGAVDVRSFHVYQPEKWLPNFYRPRFLGSLSARQRLRQARRMLQNQGCGKTILYLWRPEFRSALDMVDHDRSFYHIDDEYTFSPVELPLDPQEARLIQRVDQVFIHSPALLKKKGHLNPHTLSIPNGVDYGAYAAPHDEPEDLSPIPHPRVGYVGVIKTQMDFSLLHRLAERHREYSFVFVGPRGYLGDSAELVEKLSKMPHVYFLGGRPVGALPAYTQHFDVCIMPYCVNDYTKFIYPLKLHEYLASGRPVVGSPIQSLQDFGHVIRLARTPEEWSDALRNLIAPDASSVERIDARRTVAQEYDWNRLVWRIARSMCDRLGPSYRDRFNRLPIESA